MSIRKVSELDQIKFDEMNASRISSDSSTLGKSLVEFSWNTAGSKHDKFASKYVIYEDLSNIITYNLYHEDCIIDGNKTFLKNINVSGDIAVSGNIIFNTKSSDQITNILSIVNRDTYISSLTSITLDSPIINEYVSNNKLISVDNGTTINIGNNISIDLPSGDDDTGNLIINKKIENNNINILSTNGTGNFYFSKDIYGTAMQARWADLAEYYESDSAYPIGTLVRFAGDQEITIADYSCANAVVSDKPGFILNSNPKNNKNVLPIALIGRVKVRVIGKISKFDKIKLSKTAGIAEKYNSIISDSPILGIALESSDIADEKLILCSVKLEF